MLLRWIKTNHERLPEARVSSLCSCLGILADAQGNCRQRQQPPLGLRRLQVPIVGTPGQSPQPGILRRTHPSRTDVPLDYETAKSSRREALLDEKGGTS